MSLSSSNKALLALPRSKQYRGPFGRLFRGLHAWRSPHSDEVTAIKALKIFATNSMSEQAGANANLDNKKIPAGYTYFGQFVDHDITFDPTSSLMRQNDPDSLARILHEQCEVEVFWVWSDKPGLQGLHGVHDRLFRYDWADFGRTSPNPRCLSTCRGSTRRGSGGVQANGHHTEQLLVRTGTAFTGRRQVLLQCSSLINPERRHNGSDNVEKCGH